MARDHLNRGAIRKCSKRERYGQTVRYAARFPFRKNLVVKAVPLARYTFRHPTIAAQDRRHFSPERAQLGLYAHRDKTATVRDSSCAPFRPARISRRKRRR